MTKLSYWFIALYRIHKSNLLIKTLNRINYFFSKRHSIDQDLLLIFLSPFSLSSQLIMFFVVFFRLIWFKKKVYFRPKWIKWHLAKVLIQLSNFFSWMNCFSLQLWKAYKSFKGDTPYFSSHKYKENLIYYTCFVFNGMIYKCVFLIFNTFWNLIRYCNNVSKYRPQTTSFTERA